MASTTSCAATGAAPPQADVRRYGLRGVAFLVFFTAVVCLTLTFGLSSTASGAQPSTSTTQNTSLEQAKLRQEIRKLELENERTSSLLGGFLALAPFITALVAIVGISLTIWKQIGENAKDREQREADSLRRFDESYTRAVENLCSDSPALQISAAASLPTFLKHRYKEFHTALFGLLVANLKIDRDRAVKSFLIQAFEQALRLQLEKTDPDVRGELNLSRADLRGVDLEGLDLTRFGAIDLADADLSHANLTGAILRRTRGYKVTLVSTRLSRSDLEEARLNHARASDVRLHDVSLISATLKDADLRQGQFQRARLQSAHLERADLRGAHFEGANLNDTYFNGAALDRTALKSILVARNWRNAHFDDATRKLLDDLDGERTAAGKQVLPGPEPEGRPQEPTTVQSPDQG
jgi:uncharacterized protein YjbI with pentapeptide repeats